MSLIDKVRIIINQGADRTIKIKKNIVQLTLYKGLSILISLILVPLTLDYVDAGTYGVWLTLSSIVGWISFFDIGINNGLKNRLTEALAKGDNELGRKYVSTTYAMLSIIFIPLMVIILIITPLLDWNSFLNIDSVSNSALAAAVCIIVAYFCLNFILSTINIVLFAHQNPAEASLRNLIQQVVSIVVIYLLTLTTKGNLTYLCAALCVSPLLVVLLFNVTLFGGRYKHLRPSLDYVDFHKLPDLLILGIKFFIIQIAGVIQFQLVNFLIIRHYGAEEVTSYNIASKYFGILNMIWGILLTPIWAAVTDAAEKKEYTWICNMQNKYLKIWVLLAICGVGMLAVSNQAYNLWVGDKVSVSFWLSFWVFIYNITFMFGSIYVYTLNGLGELNVQTIASCISPFVFLGLTWFLINQGMGVSAIILGSVVSNFNGFILAPIQSSISLNKHLDRDKN